MGKSQETFSKKEKESKRLQKRKDKQFKKEQRQSDSLKGKPLEEMMAYIDEDGNISDTPSDPRRVSNIKLEDIQNGVVVRKANQHSNIRSGLVTHFNHDKGYGFIKDSLSKQNLFFHVNDTSGKLEESDRVSFETEMRAKGPVAVRVVKAES